ncbi:MAG TPA: hypothetical protein VNC12_05605 [Solirubrobacteraceae bacterium]|nr:hypothetical protein [Solirubrobacteraceae bacterium]
MDADARGFRVALVADEFVNPPPGGLDVLAVLAGEDWGAIQLPPEWYPDDVAGPLLDQVAEHVEEFVRHDYDVVRVGDRAGLAQALRALGVAAPVAITPVTDDELRAFLATHASVRPSRPV